MRCLMGVTMLEFFFGMGRCRDSGVWRLSLLVRGSMLATEGVLHACLVDEAGVDIVVALPRLVFARLHSKRRCYTWSV